jgi:hypothetical protein
MASADKHKLALKMHKHGGVFASRLADAWLHADLINQERIESVFSNFFENYVGAPD